jgi:hypothetical protein
MADELFALDENFLPEGFGGAPSKPTFTLIFRGGQTAGVPVSYTIIEDSTLVRAQGTAGVSGVLLSKSSSVVGLYPAGWSARRDQICVLSSSTAIWQGRSVFKTGDKVWVDSIGGMGTSDFLTLTFESDLAV